MAEAAQRWPAELFGQNPVKQSKKQTGQTVARLCIVPERALLGRAIEKETAHCLLTQICHF